jgi:hypothetical protein
MEFLLLFFSRLGSYSSDFRVPIWWTVKKNPAAKAELFSGAYGTTEVVPFHKPIDAKTKSPANGALVNSRCLKLGTPAKQF